MTREEAIAYFIDSNERIISVAKDENRYNYETQQIEDVFMRKDFEAKDIAIKALKQEPCEDCISRNAITKTLNEMDRYIADELTLCGSDNKFPKNEVFIVDDVYEQIVEQLSSVTDKMCFTKDNQLKPLPKERREWIPVSEGLPKEETDVLVCNINGDIEISRGSYSTEVENDFIWYTSGWRFGNVKAWMPLPEPYKREDTYGKPLKWIKASDIKSDDEWMQEDAWDEIYKQEDNLPDINVGNIKESEE